jgi:hypothetical protein
MACIVFEQVTIDVAKHHALPVETRFFRGLLKVMPGMKIKTRKHDLTFCRGGQICGGRSEYNFSVDWTVYIN